MEFRVLGPFDVLDEDGRQLDLGSPRARALLAFLVLHANEVVASERLVEELWPSGPPETASKVVHVYVSQLRKALGDSRGMLATRPPGYVLALGETDLDLRRFEALLSQADGLAGTARRQALAGDDQPGQHLYRAHARRSGHRGVRPGSLLPRRRVQLRAPCAARRRARIGRGPRRPRRGSRRVVALIRRGDGYSQATGGSFVRAARSLGLTATTRVWEERASYADLAAAVVRQDPDAVYVAGGSIANGRRLVADLRSALGPQVTILAADGWAGLAAALGAVGEGLLVTSSGVPTELLPPRGRELIRAVEGSAPRGRAYMAEAAQAAEVLLDAISRSDGTRASVVEQLFESRVRGGIIRDFGFDDAGDIDPALFWLYRFTGGKDELVRLVRARPELVHAQR